MSLDANSVAETLSFMRNRLARVVPDAELQLKAELVYEIIRKKRERGALILGHNYMEPALFHTVPDMVGDSLALSRQAAKTDRDPIIFCGVRFMAETAKIVNPKKTVLLPSRREAGCSLASSITAQDVRDLKQKFPGVPVVTYINSYADVKAETDICCTSGNAVKVVNSLKEKQIIFIPDEFLAKNVARETGKSLIVASKDAHGDLKISEMQEGLNESSAGMIAWSGRCEVHEKFQPSDVLRAREQFDDLEVLAHPECAPEVVELSDFADSTTRMVDYVKQSKARRFLILTECSMGDNIIAENPDKEIVRLCSIRCPHMNQITLEDTLYALEHNQQQIEVDEEIRRKALNAVERMLAIG